MLISSFTAFSISLGAR